MNRHKKYFSDGAHGKYMLATTRPHRYSSADRVLGVNAHDAFANTDMQLLLEQEDDCRLGTREEWWVAGHRGEALLKRDRWLEGMRSSGTRERVPGTAPKR
jgi:hypothetical protein